MKHCNRSYLAVLAAVAGMPFFAAALPGQVRVDTSGHASDANPQIGSGGYNQALGNVPPTPTQTQNALINNSIGGFGYRSRTYNGVSNGAGYTNPFGFRGLLAGQGVDQFISTSTGMPTMANPNASSDQAANPSTPPPSFFGLANQPLPQSSEDARLGVLQFSGQGQTQILPKPNELLLPGPVDPTANPPTTAQLELSASSLYGVLVVPPNGQQSGPDQLYTQQSGVFATTPLQQGTGISPVLAPTPTQVRLNQLRQELLAQGKIGIGTQNVSGNLTSGSALNPLRPGGQNSNLDQPLPAMAPKTSQLNSPDLTAAPGDVNTSQSNREYLPNEALPPPTQQSTQYAKLRQSLEDYNSEQPMTDEEANRKFQAILRLRTQAKVNAEGGAERIDRPRRRRAGQSRPTPCRNPRSRRIHQPRAAARCPRLGTEYSSEQTGIHDHAEQPGAAQGMGLPPISAPPVPIDSFATGIQAKGLAGLIANAELNVEQHHYDKAIAQYNEAFDVAPNNPLILMARAPPAGGGYYAQANTDIHVAVDHDPAVLMGQYDLQKHLGPDRLKSLLADLKQLAKASNDDTLHAFLLTFAYYNSQHVGQAVDWLNITDQRGNGQDPAIVQMKKYWNFNEDQQPSPAAPVVPPSSARPSTRPSGKN